MGCSKMPCTRLQYVVSREEAVGRLKDPAEVGLLDAIQQYLVAKKCDKVGEYFTASAIMGSLSRCTDVYCLGWNEFIPFHVSEGSSLLTILHILSWNQWPVANNDNCRQVQVKTRWDSRFKRCDLHKQVLY